MLWFDAEAHFLEVHFSDDAGFEKETTHNAVMERVDAQGNVIGFSILGVSRFNKEKPSKAVPPMGSTLLSAFIKIAQHTIKISCSSSVILSGISAAIGATHFVNFYEAHLSESQIKIWVSQVRCR